MSRGHGATQRAILAYLEAQPREHRRWGTHSVEHLQWPAWHPVEDMTHYVFHPGEDDWIKPSRAQLESVRRAVKRLAAEGLAEVEMRTWGTRRNDPRLGRIDVDMPKLSVRPVLTDAERTAELEASNASARRIAEILREARR